MPVSKKCEQCGRGFTVVPARKDTARYCGKVCANVAQRRSERRDISCEACGKAFNTPQDHGEWPRFCSRECFLSVCVRPADRNCEWCRQPFMAYRSSATGELAK